MVAFEIYKGPDLNEVFKREFESILFFQYIGKVGVAVKKYSWKYVEIPIIQPNA